jgi:glycosyltransferase involved in cell wall biosynthesis
MSAMPQPSSTGQGFVVPPHGPAAPAAAVSVMAAMPPEAAALRKTARCRIERNFSINAVVRCYEALYEELMHVAPTNCG